MSHRNHTPPSSIAISIALLATLLAACSAGDETPGSPASTPAPTGEAPVPAEPPADAAPTPAEPSLETPPPEDAVASQEPLAASAGPALDSMLPATPSAKMSVPVDLRYSLAAADEADGELVLHLAAVPRVPLSNLKVSPSPESGLRARTQNITVGKAEASQAYRQQFEVMRRTDGPQQIRVMVTADLGEGVGFGVFTIPLATGGTPEKQQSVKQH